MYLSPSFSEPRAPNLGRRENQKCRPALASAAPCAGQRRGSSPRVPAASSVVASTRAVSRPACELSLSLGRLAFTRRALDPIDACEALSFDRRLLVVGRQSVEIDRRQIAHAHGASRNRPRAAVVDRTFVTAQLARRVRRRHGRLLSHLDALGRALARFLARHGADRRATGPSCQGRFSVSFPGERE